MPYYIYRIGPLNLLEKQAQADTFKAAKAIANELRKQLDPRAGQTIKMIFAENEIQAEDTLSQPRELDPSLAGDDY
jgi:diadenosine tetraphosphate (Ap4A) HIT family hydrolase